MITQSELKTLIPAFVAPCVLLYESISGNHISESSQTALTNGILIGAGFIVSMWGVYKNHQKKPPDQTPSVLPKTEVHIKEETEQKAVATPIVTQTDLNKQISN